MGQGHGGAGADQARLDSKAQTSGGGGSVSAVTPMATVAASCGRRPLETWNST